MGGGSCPGRSAYPDGCPCRVQTPRRVTAWLDATGDIASAAAHVRVHPNTLRHRLRRVRELFGLDLNDPEVRLAAWLELRVAQR
ncbi:helix-turn-helix domain-containing protein [Streptomyces sp. NPDC046821]|uniref:helix-turn-helix domain-containing protein n=1 Tax=Streptomyces sp. NPDC046821 TaxID=3154702 RepID=UPI00340AD42B